MTCPVIYDDKSDARNKHKLATSCVSPGLLRGIVLFQDSITDADKLSVISVLIKPGAMTLHLILLAPNSIAIDFENPIIPDFDAA